MRDMMSKVSKGNFGGMEQMFGNGMGGRLAKMSMNRMVRKQKKLKQKRMKQLRRKGRR